ncbi:hypothetical protein ACFL27_06960 [candidate division CSSED10-310 bacterium]|uniref:Uncharacterized protein n=1 Tax=candidate division CSSED10-310 bacterium TaxID=2855610 RepID=A0ABV6YUS2_UNCC1
MVPKSIYSILALLCSTLLILFCYCLFLSQTSVKKSGGQVSLNKLGEKIHGSQTMGQSFVCEEAGLRGVKVKFATYARSNTALYHFTLKRDGPLGEKLYGQSFEARDVADNQFHFFTFPARLNDSHLRYYFEISSSEAAPGNCITIWYHDQDRYAAGSRFVSGQKKSGDLAFQYFHKQPLPELGTRITAHRPGILNSRWIYFFMFFMFVLTMQLFFFHFLFYTR